MASSQEAVLQLPLRPGHNYADIGGSGSARLHLGNSYVINQNTDDQNTGRVDFNGHYSSTALRPVISYVARPELQAQMKERLHDTIEQRSRSSKILVVCGLGGAGKSQLTLKYIEKYREDYTAIFWIDAGARTRLEADYKQLRNMLYSSRRTDVDLHNCVADVKQWCHHKNGRWLFVFDSADDIDNPQSPAYIDLQRIVIDSPSADIVITTRSQSAKDMTDLDAVQVAELSLSEARDLFLRRSKLPTPTSTTIHEEVDAIVEELGFFALAVNLAAAHVAETPRLRKNPGIYLNEYRRRRRNLLERKPKAHVDQYGASVLASWETSHAAMADRCPEACNLLAFLSFLSPDDLFLDLFQTEDEAVINGHASWLFAGAPSTPVREALDTALEILGSYSLVLWRDEQEGYSMHKLVHAWSYERMEADSKVSFCYSALGFLDYYAKLAKGPKLITRIVPHIMSCFIKACELYKTDDMYKAKSVDDLHNFGNFLHGAGETQLAYEVRSFVHDHYRQYADARQYRYYDSVDALGTTMFNQGRCVQAVELLRPVLLECRQNYGPDYPPARRIAVTLGIVLGYQDEYKEAEELLRWALNGCKTKDDFHEPEALFIMSELARFLSFMGRMTEAEDLGRHNLCGMDGLYGSLHRDTLVAKNTLGMVLFCSGKWEEAEILLRPALEDCELVMGSKHPITLNSIQSYGSACLHLGKFIEAEKLIRRALAGLEEVGGMTHPQTLHSVEELAIVLREQKSYDEALGLHQRAADGYAALYGIDNRRTRRCFEDVADLRSFLERRAAFLETSKQASMRFTERLHLIRPLNSRGRALTYPGCPPAHTGVGNRLREIRRSTFRSQSQ